MLRNLLSFGSKPDVDDLDAVAGLYSAMSDAYAHPVEALMPCMPDVAKAFARVAESNRQKSDLLTRHVAAVREGDRNLQQQTRAAFEAYRDQAQTQEDAALAFIEDEGKAVSSLALAGSRARVSAALSQYHVERVEREGTRGVSDLRKIVTQLCA